MSSKQPLLAVALLLLAFSAGVAQGASRYCIKGVPHIRQEQYLCGAASCAMVLGYYRYRTDQQEIAECDVKGIEKEVGIEASKMVSFLRRQGVRATLEHGDLRRLHRYIEDDIPVIVLTWADLDKNNRHYRVVVGFDERKETVVYIDPSDAREHEIEDELFLRLWEASGAGVDARYLMIVVYP